MYTVLPLPNKETISKNFRTGVEWKDREAMRLERKYKCKRERHQVKVDENTGQKNAATKQPNSIRLLNETTQQANIHIVIENKDDLVSPDIQTNMEQLIN